MKVILEAPHGLIRTRCNHCGCLFGYQTGDVIIGSDNIPYITCPCCNKEVVHLNSNNSIMHG